MNGKEIMKGELETADTKINCASLLPGNYFLLVQQQEKIFSGQFLKK